MVIGQREPDGSMTILEDVQRIPRLGQGEDEAGVISQDAIDRGVEVLREYRALLGKYGHPEVVCVGTSALRDAANQDEVVWDLGQAIEATVWVIDGETEAKMTFEGTVGDDTSPAIVVDIGGGSTEFVLGENGKPGRGVSLDIGCVRMTERWCKNRPVAADQQQNLRSEIRRSLQRQLGDLDATGHQLVGVAGTATALAMLSEGASVFQPKEIEGYVLTKFTVGRLADSLLSMSGSELDTLPGVDLRRADVLPAGAAILHESMDFLGIDEVRVSVRGLRYGALRLAAGISS